MSAREVISRKVQMKFNNKGTGWKDGSTTHGRTNIHGSRWNPKMNGIRKDLYSIKTFKKIKSYKDERLYIDLGFLLEIQNQKKELLNMEDCSRSTRSK
ncbi:hypothetical protein SUGI_0632070 [Cryptomeria japonica]|nr:hypothetical protein SUGI_0632070 [Cryptomeria japonica]